MNQFMMPALPRIMSEVRTTVGFPSLTVLRLLQSKICYFKKSACPNYVFSQLHQQCVGSRGFIHHTKWLPMMKMLRIGIRFYIVFLHLLVLNHIAKNRNIS